ncbi:MULTISPECIES: Fur family transcriptional regulator [Clostridium]|uniref:Fur family transcriptional regulator n=1 Tax=Clostridium TaxID=1485 RepID=UPI000824D630|nr:MULTISPECIES: transcriptional repressor [Clostridium]PJI07534.1 transcriptional repressor [Clostridium sp. CT7]
MTKEEISYYRNILASNGCKFTIQKQIILQKLMKSSIHLNAQEIYEKIKYEDIGLATVYRTLKLFCKLGIIEEINIKNINYYEMKSYKNKNLYMHFKCSKCGKILDIDSKKLSLEKLKLKNVIEEEYDLSIHDVNIVFTGICSNCKSEDDTGSIMKV